jgi:hypothetical protein
MFIGGDAPPPGPPPYDPGPPPAAVSPAAAARVEPPVAQARDGGSDDGWIKRRRWPLAGALTLLGAVIAAVLILSSGSSSTSGDKAKATPKPAPAGRRIAGNLGPVPTNRVKGDGTAVLRLSGNVATVSLTTHNMLDGAAHALHIHAGARGQCPSKRAAKLHNGNLSIATKSGVPFYGHAVTALTTRGNTDPDRSLVAFNRYPKTGEIRYERKINVGPVVASYIRKNNAVVVVHGIDYNHNGIYDGTLDRSDLNPSLTGESTAPGVCGTLIASKAKSASSSKKSSGGGGTTGAVQTGTREFAAVLGPEGGNSEPARAPAWHCVLPPVSETGAGRV